MDYQDSNPERRNLSVLSLAFIAYFWAGGSMGPEFRFLISSLTFNRPEILGWLSWAVLLWFLYRYWLHHRGFRQQFRTEVRSQSLGMQIVKRLARGAAAQKAADRGYDLDEVSAAFFEYVEANGDWAIYFDVTGKKQVATNGTTPVFARDSWRYNTPLPGIAAQVALRLAHLRAIVFEKSFSSIMAPYLLFWVAVASGAWSRFA